MKIRTKLIGAFGVVTLMTLSVSLLGFLQTQKLSSALYEIGVVRLPSIEGLDEIELAMTELDSLPDEPVDPAKTPPDISVREKKAFERLQRGWDLYEPLPQTKEESEKWKAFVAAVNQWKQKRRSKDPATAEQFATAMRLLGEVIAVNDQIVKAEKLRTIASFGDSVRVQENMLLASILALAIAVFVGLFLGKEITRPLGVITGSLAKIGKGDLQTRIETKSVDELGDVARATNRLAEELSNTEARVKLLSDNLPADMVYQFELQPDGGTRFTYVSAGVERLHGRSAEEFLRRPEAVYEQVIEEDRPQLHQARERSLSTMTPFEAIVRVRRKDGEIRWMHLSSAPRRLPDRRVIWDGSERDITATRQAEEELRRRKALLEAQVHSSPDGILVVDESGRKTLQNQRLAEFWGIPPSVAKDPDYESQLQFFVEQVKRPEEFLARIQHLEKNRDRIGQDEIELKDGKILERYSAPVLDEHGIHYGRICTFKDITQRKEAEGRIQLLQTITSDIAKAEDLKSAFRVVLQRLCEKAGWELGHAWLVDADGKDLRMAAAWVGSRADLREFSRASENLTLKRGMSLPGWVLETCEAMWVPDLATHRLSQMAPRRESALRVGLKTALAVPIVSDREVIAVLEFGIGKHRAEDPGLIEFTQTIATQIGFLIQKKRAEDMMRHSHQQLRALAGRLQAVREEERTRIAREIHDVLAQELTRLRIDLGWLKTHVAKAEKALLLIEKLDGSIDTTNAAIMTVQKIATELRPVVLDSMGLAAAIEWQAEEVQQRTGIQCDAIVSDHEFGLERAAETNIFRIVQESINNIIRHAKATKIEIILERNQDRLRLVVQDNGIGFDPSRLKDTNSLGLLGMRERALMMDGQFEIRSSPGKGTQITVTVPLPKSAAGDASNTGDSAQ